MRPVTNLEPARRSPRAQRSKRYVVQETLASGGMGIVYRVQDRATGEELALKRPSKTGEHQRIALESFEREYQVLASLDHPRIIRVFDYGVDDDGPYYTMEYIEGEDLRHAAPLPYRRAALYMRDVAACLALLHARRLIHRDLSPSNVRRTSDGHCKLLDFGALLPFGLAEALIGTAPGVPPEALDGSPLDQRADLYALGALAYWTLTGRHAYPARHIDDLFEVWNQPPPPPSAIVPEIPSELDTLVLSLLSLDPFARPGSAAEVIARLNVLAELPEEDTTEAQRLAQSFLVNPRFAGRSAQLMSVQRLVDATLSGRGGAMRVQAISGMGRSRLLQEIAVRTQVAGVTVLRVDAAMYPSKDGTARALVTRLLEALPREAVDCSAWSREALHALGPEIQALLESVDEPTVRTTSRPDGRATLDQWFAEVSLRKPLALLVDNVEHADNASLALLAGLAKLSGNHPLLLVVTERTQPEATPALGLLALRAYSTLLELTPLTAGEMLELTHSLFGDAPNVKRFADWLHGRSAGSPLHAVEIVRQLIGKQVIRYTGGIWTIPFDKPDAELPAALEDVLSLRIASLSEPARILAECLSLQNEQPTLDLCRLITQSEDDRQSFAVLDELARNDVLYAERGGYRFSSVALCHVLLSGMDSERLEQNHRRLGEAFTKLSTGSSSALTLQAGWHFIKGGDERRGADMIARIAADPVATRTMLANLHRAGDALDAALNVYGRQRLSVYERLPLLSSLAQAGYYEDRRWAERYADSALDALEHVSGVGLARRLRPVFGRWLALIVGILFAALRFALIPRRERPYSFADVLIHLFGTVTTSAAAAAVSLDAERAIRVAEVLEPFSVLPERLTPVGIYEFCKALAEIGRDNEAFAYRTFDELLRRFQDPRYYKSLPDDGRKIYVAAAHFARASFAIFRAHSETALESADALERLDFKLYQAIASQLRILYHTNRGEYAKAAVHREQLELRAAHLGSLWQVETWEAPALILVYTLLSDIVSSTRVAQRLELLSASVPSLKRYAQLAKQGLMLSRGDRKYSDPVANVYRNYAPRSFIGWGATMAFVARGYNELGRHEDARAVCETVLRQIDDADKEYVSHFLGVDIQLAIADAAMTRFDAALARIDGLLQRFANSDHPLVHGLLHDTRARICFACGDIAAYERSLHEVERRFVSTGTPILIAKYKRLSELAHSRATVTPWSLARGRSGERLRDVDGEFLTRTLCGTEVTVQEGASAEHSGPSTQ